MQYYCYNRASTEQETYTAAAESSTMFAIADHSFTVSLSQHLLFRYRPMTFSHID